ncbi:glycerophosphodiester phosphodiesterase [Paenibacillus filicis]|uniref:Glycerophosphodiester phosphodiesterase n=1 Tax=Paenibacillus gyeongsangnamensis TaxID=3388067 RepID=A0ABT4Q6X0_9BACL|nr:glycerophosphodiester phosphodiesterase [Paenibacillus filicis]MCZ8512581.1 glycerophosphodiester phosphodiesterase [Paenibacillus filicis]
MTSLQAKPLIIGHRGAAGEAPENTLASFALALRQGADAIELDIHVSADGELVVCHDATVNRTTNGEGAIAELTAASLKRLDAGGWFAERYAGEPVPLLEEVFSMVPAGIMINVEIKCAYSPRLEERLFELLKQFDRLEGVVVSSFNHKVLQRLKRSEPRLRIGLLYSSNFANHRKVAEVSGFEVYSLHPYYRLISPEDVADAAAHGLSVYPYTINRQEDLLAAIEAGMSGIITDYPGRLRELLKSRLPS